jgi:hypothetical protein
MKTHTSFISQSGIGRFRIMTIAMAAAMLFLGPQASADNNDESRTDFGRGIVGNWYLALDAGPFDPGLSGTFLSGLAQFHSDRTFMINDAGDFGADSFFGTLASPQYGAWRIERDAHHKGASIDGTAIYLEVRKPSGELLGWNKVHFKLHVVSRNRVEGTINAFFLPCADAPPFPTPLTCPDPVANAAAFVPASPPDVPITMTRIIVGQ